MGQPHSLRCTLKTSLIKGLRYRAHYGAVRRLLMNFKIHKQKKKNYQVLLVLFIVWPAVDPIHLNNNVSSFVFHSSSRRHFVFILRRLLIETFIAAIIRPSIEEINRDIRNFSVVSFIRLLYKMYGIK